MGPVVSDPPAQPTPNQRHGWAAVNHALLFTQPAPAVDTNKSTSDDHSGTAQFDGMDELPVMQFPDHVDALAGSNAATPAGSDPYS